MAIKQLDKADRFTEDIPDLRRKSKHIETMLLNEEGKGEIRGVEKVGSTKTTAIHVKHK